MSQLIASPTDCCNPCGDGIPATTPGPQGDSGAAGTNGTNGVSAFTTVANYLPAAQPAMPDGALAGTVVVNTTSSTAFMTVGEPVYVQTWGTMIVTALTASSVTLLNPEDGTGAYAGNAGTGTLLAASTLIVPGGIQGITGINPLGALIAANNLSDVTLVASARTNLGLGTIATRTQGQANTNVPIIDDAAGLTNGEAVFATATGIESKTAALARTALNAQELDAFLTSIAALGTAADKIIYTTGVNIAAETDFTLLARSLAAANTLTSFRMLIGGVKRQYGLLGSINNMNLNSAATDQAITIDATRYRIDKVVVDDATVNMTTATGGVFTAAGGGGTTIAADQSLAALTAPTKFRDLTLAGIIATDALTSATIYFRTGTAQGVAATADVYVFGWALDNP